MRPDEKGLSGSSFDCNFCNLFFQSNDQEKVKIGSSASPEKLTQRDYQGPPKKSFFLSETGWGLIIYF